METTNILRKEAGKIVETEADKILEKVIQLEQDNILGKEVEKIVEIYKASIFGKKVERVTEKKSGKITKKEPENITVNETQKIAEKETQKITENETQKITEKETQIEPEKFMETKASKILEQEAMKTIQMEMVKTLQIKTDDISETAAAKISEMEDSNASKIDSISETAEIVCNLCDEKFTDLSYTKDHLPAGFPSGLYICKKCYSYNTCFYNLDKQPRCTVAKMHFSGNSQISLQETLELEGKTNLLEVPEINIDSSAYDTDSDPNTYYTDNDTSAYGTDIHSNAYYMDINQSEYYTDIDPSAYDTDIHLNAYDTDIGPSAYYTDIGPSAYYTDIGPSAYYTDIGPSAFDTDIHPSAYDTDIHPSAYDMDIHPIAYYTYIGSRACGTDIHARARDTDIYPNECDTNIQSSACDTDIQPSTSDINMNSSVSDQSTFDIKPSTSGICKIAVDSKDNLQSYKKMVLKSHICKTCKGCYKSLKDLLNHNVECMKTLNSRASLEIQQKIHSHDESHSYGISRKNFSKENGKSTQTHLAEQSLVKPCRFNMKEESENSSEMQDVYICKVCNTFFSTNSSFSKHLFKCWKENCKKTIKLQNANKPYGCSDCKRHYKTKESLQSHQDVCRKHFMTYYGKLLNDEDVLQPYICEACNKEFNSGGSLDHHREFCTKLYLSRTAHSQNNTQKTFVCEACNRHYKTEPFLIKHRSNCKRKFSMKPPLKLEQQVSFEDGSHNSQVFKKEFTKEWELSPLPQHSDLNGLYLTKVPKTVIVSGEDEKEKKKSIHERKPFICIILNCKKRFATESALKDHIASHKHKFDCKHCFKWFDNQNDWDAHKTECSEKWKKTPTGKCKTIYKEESQSQ